MDVGWTYSLTSLESLELYIQGLVTFQNGLSQLQKLTRLTVLIEPKVKFPSLAHFEVDWKTMHALQQLKLSGRMTFLDNVQYLALIKDLTCVALNNFSAGNCQTTVYVARLAYRLADNRPEVRFNIESPPMSRTGSH